MALNDRPGDDERDDAPTHLKDDTPWVRWDWRREDPVEIILVIFILVLFFILPRPGCGIDDKGGNVSGGEAAPLRASNE